MVPCHPPHTHYPAQASCYIPSRVVTCIVPPSLAKPSLLPSSACGLAMASSFSLTSQNGSSLERGLRNSPSLRLRQLQWPRLSHDKARCATQTCIRSVASDFAKRINHTNVNNLESSTSDLLTSTASPIVSPGDLSLLQPHLYPPDTSQELPIDVLCKGRFVKNKPIYRQMFVIRSYEVGFDKTASIETIINLFQETSLNHLGMLDFMGDGMGTLQSMIPRRLIWVVTRMHIEMVRYPVWGEVVQIDAWLSSSGKNGVRRDFLVQDYATGSILGRATSNWALMNQDTRKLSKMPKDVRTEIGTQFVDRRVIDEDDNALKRIPLLDDLAPFKSTGLVPKLHDLDMNQHVNHVKYIDWVMESLPESLMKSCELSKLTLEYRRECGSSDVLESFAQSNMPSNLNNLGHKLDEDAPLGFTHLLRQCGSSSEVLRARTQWRSKRQ